MQSKDIKAGSKVRGPYPNPDFFRGVPPGQPGLIAVGGRGVQARQESPSIVWYRIGNTDDWHLALSRLTRETFTPDTNR
ncbi:hypothetical protein [Nostocoides jenkinsii]|nr:hypothetical protein [Tetrasphaera jenkinsii]